jgi:hypothetical protein
MIFWSLCAFIWFKNMKEMLLQMTGGFLQLESTIYGNSQRDKTLVIPDQFAIRPWKCTKMFIPYVPIKYKIELENYWFTLCKSVLICS